MTTVSHQRKADYLEEASALTEFYFQWHITNRCNRRCEHCYHNNYDANVELDEQQLFVAADYLEQAVKAWGRRGVLSLTGGEPFMRREALYALLDRLKSGGVFEYADILTNGSLLTDEDCTILAKHPFLRRVQVSLEGASPSVNDAIRGKGAFEDTVRAIQKLKGHDVEVAVMMTLSRLNVHEAVPLMELLSSLRVDTFAFERFIPEGQAEAKREHVLSPNELCKVFSAIHDWGMAHATPRVLMYRPLMCLTNPTSHYVGAMCSVGINALTLMPDGTVFPCRRLPLPLGNILVDSLHDIWMQSPILWKVRTPGALKGKCGNCQYLPICRGCRAQALALTGDWLEDDPQCWREQSELWSLADNVRLGNPDGTEVFFAYNSVSGEQFELNATAHAVLKKLEKGATSLESIVDAICQEFDAGQQEVLQDIVDLISTLGQWGLIIKNSV